MSLKSSTVETGNATHLLERLSSMHKALGFIPTPRKPRAHSCNPCMEERRQEDQKIILSDLVSTEPAWDT